MSSKQKDFDAVAMVREIRDRIAEQIAGMTVEEELEWLAAQDIQDPVLRRLREKAARQEAEPVGRRPAREEKPSESGEGGRSG